MEECFSYNLKKLIIRLWNTMVSKPIERMGAKGKTFFLYPDLLLKGSRSKNDNKSFVSKNKNSPLYHVSTATVIVTQSILDFFVLVCF